MSEERPQKQKRYSLGCILIIGMFLAAGAYLCFKAGKVEFGEHAARVDWLPSTASDVSFYKSYAFTAYEFTISKEDFVAWSRQKGWPIEELSSPEQNRWKSLTVMRYCYIPIQEKAGKDPSIDLEAARASITRGYGYELRWPNGGGITVAYDSENHRAYVQTSPR